MCLIEINFWLQPTSRRLTLIRASCGVECDGSVLALHPHHMETGSKIALAGFCKSVVHNASYSDPALDSLQTGVSKWSRSAQADYNFALWHPFLHFAENAFQVAALAGRTLIVTATLLSLSMGHSYCLHMVWVRTMCDEL